MSAHWVPVTDVKAWLALNGNRRVREHAFTAKILHWALCTQCGLLLLRNPATRLAARGKCITYED